MNAFIQGRVKNASPTTRIGINTMPDGTLLTTEETGTPTFFNVVAGVAAAAIPAAACRRVAIQNTGAGPVSVTRLGSAAKWTLAAGSEHLFAVAANASELIVSAAAPENLEIEIFG